MCQKFFFLILLNNTAIEVSTFTSCGIWWHFVSEQWAGIAFGYSIISILNWATSSGKVVPGTLRIAISRLFWANLYQAIDRLGRSVRHYLRIHVKEAFFQFNGADRCGAVASWDHQLTDEATRKDTPTLVLQTKGKAFLRQMEKDDVKWICFETCRRNTSWVDLCQRWISSTEPNH